MMMTISELDERTFLPRPIIGVGAVVWHQDHVLLIQRGKEPNIGSWSIPGGAQELGETVRDAVCREVMEETGVKISSPILVDTVDLIAHTEEDKVEYHYTLIDFVAVALNPDISLGGDAADAKWVKVNEVTNYNLWNKTIDIIAKSRTILEGR
ncbi:NUDIX hydrolase [Thalassospira profundimaris]|uniref:NUDIX hydrolase n=2 Tax=Thalassospira profundimaris TaxID=502049 RepID=A0A367WNN3_9PROT|nr:NUDIX hydrolase [Thalassospira profundimaris]